MVDQLVVDLHITGRLLIGMGKKLKPLQLCSHFSTQAQQRADVVYSAQQQQQSQVGPCCLPDFLLMAGRLVGIVIAMQVCLTKQAGMHSSHLQD